MVDLDSRSHWQRVFVPTADFVGAPSLIHGGETLGTLSLWPRMPVHYVRTPYTTTPYGGTELRLRPDRTVYGVRITLTKKQ